MTLQHDDFAAIAALDLDPIKVKLMHKESGEGWTLEQANAVEFEYRRFLYLMKKFSTEGAAPRFDVDIFWHYHILDTMKYAQDCDDVFGYFLHHFPYVGLRGEDDLAAHERLGERMRELYEGTFNEPYMGRATANSSAVVEQTAFSFTPSTAESASRSRTAFSFATQVATEATADSRTAFSFATQVSAGVTSGSRTAFSFATQAAAGASSGSRTAFSFMPQTAAQLASKGLPQLPDSKADAPWNEHAAGFSTVRPSLASVAAGI